MDSLPHIGDLIPPDKPAAAGPSQYYREKMSGTRMRSGSKPIRHLKGRHLRIVLMHMAGISNDQIAKQLHCTPPWVSQVLRHPIVQDYKMRIAGQQEDEFRGLFGKSIGVLRDAMDSMDEGIKLRAVDIMMRGQGRYKTDSSEKKLTAEDIVERMLQVAESGQDATMTISVKGNSP